MAACFCNMRCPPQGTKVGSVEQKRQPTAQQQGASTQTEQPTLRTDNAKKTSQRQETAQNSNTLPLTTPLIFGDVLIVRRRTRRQLQLRTAAAASLWWEKRRIPFHLSTFHTASFLFMLQASHATATLIQNHSSRLLQQFFLRHPNPCLHPVVAFFSSCPGRCKRNKVHNGATHL